MTLEAGTHAGRWTARTPGLHYTFSRMKVWDGWSVVAVKSGDGRGPSPVVTGNAGEMMTALGLKPSQ
jgi:hypothetical protein